MNRTAGETIQDCKNTMKMIMEEVQRKEPLIHCITNPISIHDCANAVLAVGARPIMAEHPREVREITSRAKALALNIGNITDARRESIFISGMEAAKREIPVVMDMVGMGCSSMRKEIVKEFLRMREEIKQDSPLILKGNISEIKALQGEGYATDGIDAKKSDMLTEENKRETLGGIRRLAAKHHAVILATGKTDVTADSQRVYLTENGCQQMSEITGTGCMLTVLAAAYSSQGALMEAGLLAAAVSGICGERASQDWRGTGTFQVRLMDEFSQCSWEKIEKNWKVGEWNE